MNFKLNLFSSLLSVIALPFLIKESAQVPFELGWTRFGLGLVGLGNKGFPELYNFFYISTLALTCY